MNDLTALHDLAVRSLGGSVMAASDELFAERENLIKPEAPAYSTYTFGHKGQVYDGWETRRRREPGHDFAIVRLGAAGRSAIHRATSASPCPRDRAAVQTAGRLSWSEAMPPQAAPKSPLPGCFSPGGQGEWSEATRSTSPSASPCQSRSRLAASRIGGQHLNWVAPSGISSAQRAR